MGKEKEKEICGQDPKDVMCFDLVQLKNSCKERSNNREPSPDQTESDNRGITGRSLHVFECLNGI